VPKPVPATGQMLVAMRASDVSPLTIELVEPVCKHFPPPFACSNSTIGSGGAGVVAAVGPDCAGFTVGDEVWGTNTGAYADYAIASCGATGLKPKSLSFAEAGVSLEGVTSLQCLQMAGAPWEKKNLTVAITSGQGGTGLMAIQLAKALGAARVVTAATGDGIELVKTFGADVVYDYHKTDLFEALPDDSVDVVFDNLARPGTADKAMHAIRSSGTYLVLTGGGGDISKNPKEGVTQLKFYAVDMSNRTIGVDVLAPLFDAGKLRGTHIFDSFSVSAVADAFTRYLAGGVVGKIAVLMDH